MNYAFGSHSADFAFQHVPHSGDSAVAIIVGSDAINASPQAGLFECNFVGEINQLTFGSTVLLSPACVHNIRPLYH